LTEYINEANKGMESLNVILKTQSRNLDKFIAKYDEPITMSNMVAIKKELLLGYEIDRIQNECNLYRHGYSVTLECTYDEDKEYIYLPIVFGYKMFKQFKVDDERSIGEKICLSFKRHLQMQDDRSETQIEMVSRFIHSIDHPGILSGRLSGVGFFVSPPGTGKTVMGTDMICQIDKTAIILVNDNMILDQWVNALRKFTNIEREDIGMIKGSKVEWEGKKVVLCMLQSLHRKDMPEEFYKNFGVMIYDEAHRAGSNKLGIDIVKKFHSRYKIGITATPRRSDKFFKAISQHMGEVLCEGSKVEMSQLGIYWNRFLSWIGFDNFMVDISDQVLVPTVYIMDTGILFEADNFVYVPPSLKIRVPDESAANPSISSFNPPV